MKLQYPKKKVTSNCLSAIKSKIAQKRYITAPPHIKAQKSFIGRFLILGYPLGDIFRRPNFELCKHPLFLCLNILFPLFHRSFYHKEVLKLPSPFVFLNLPYHTHIIKVFKPYLATQHSYITQPKSASLEYEILALL